MMPRPALRVIAVDDDRAVIAALRELFLDEGYDLVGVAHDADSGIRLAAATQPGVAIVDMTMPGGGAAATLGIRAACAGTSVIVLSAHDHPRFLAEAKGAGAHRYLVKGVDDLAAAIREMDAARGAAQ